MSKYDETARNITNIEVVVGKLVEELGSGGFMNIHDIVAGMYVEITDVVTGEIRKTAIAAVQGDDLLLANDSANVAFFDNGKKKTFEIKVMVNNAMYIWSDVGVVKKDYNGTSYYQLVIEGNPKVVNRRKYPRFPMNNKCEIVLKQSRQRYFATMVNISAGGYAFSCREKEFAQVIGQEMELLIHEYDEIVGVKIIYSYF